MTHDTPVPRGGCDAGIVFALAVEADAFERRASGGRAWQGTGPACHEATLAGARVAWCVSGVGGGPAARAARLLVDGHRPAVLVSAGFAGGLDPALPRGAVVRPGAVVRSAAATDRLSLAPTGAAGPLLVSVDGVVDTVDRKRELAARCGAAVVDMETHAVATIAAAAGLPCRAVRVVSDDATQTLPAEVAALARPQSAVRRFGAVLGALGRRPGVAVDLWRLYEHAVVDSRALAAALEELCREIAAERRFSAGPPGSGPADCGAGPRRSP